MVVRDFEHDVFVSYAQLDNKVAHGAAHPSGWVTTLVENLNSGPNARPKDIFIDYRLGPGDEFSSELLRKVERSAILLILVSQNYVNSHWCCQELRHFIRTRAEDPQRPRNVFLVELGPSAGLVNRPTELDAVRKHSLAAKFWFKRPQDPIRVAGWLWPNASKDDDGHYWRECDRLRSFLEGRLMELGTPAKAAMGQKETKVTDLCSEPAITRQTL